MLAHMFERRTLTKRVRFEILKRDNFACRYCGAKPPDVVLHCDHVHPVSRGGKNELENLVTSCRDCNAGKGACLIEDRPARPPVGDARADTAAARGARMTKNKMAGG